MALFYDILRVMKKCYRCKETKPLSEFHKNKHRKDGVQTRCKSCKKETDAQYRLENMEYFIERAKKQKEELFKWYREYKSGLKCKNCHENRSVCLDFHHRDRKVKFASVSKMIARGFSKAKIMEEIEKCDVLCANCHRVEESSKWVYS